MEPGVEAPIFISALAVFASAMFGLLSFRDRRAAARLSREAELHQWVQQVAAIIAEIRTTNAEDRDRAVVKLSLQIDYGRLLFPNEETSEAQKWNPRGRRSSILDPLVETCHRASNEDWSDDKIAADWREFVDQVRKRTTAFQIDTSPEASGHTQYRNR